MENEAKFLETKKVIIDCNAAKYDSIWTFWLPNTVSEIWQEFFFKRNIHTKEMSIFVNFDLDLHFQGHMLQE